MLSNSILFQPRLHAPTVHHFRPQSDAAITIRLFHAAAMTTRERGQVRINSSKMASKEMETPVLDDNKNFNNVQTPSPSVWSKRLDKVRNISFGWVEEFCKKAFDLQKKIQSKGWSFFISGYIEWERLAEKYCIIRASCYTAYRSMKKSESPHRLKVSICFYVKSIYLLHQNRPKSRFMYL